MAFMMLLVLFLCGPFNFFGRQLSLYLSPKRFVDDPEQDGVLCWQLTAVFGSMKGPFQGTNAVTQNKGWLRRAGISAHSCGELGNCRTTNA
jgi:hypothetical protein